MLYLLIDTYIFFYQDPCTFPQEINKNVEKNLAMSKKFPGFISSSRPAPKINEVYSRLSPFFMKKFHGNLIRRHG